MNETEHRSVLLEAEDDRAHARAVFLWGMIGGLVLTLTANIAVAFVKQNVALTVIVHAMPPLLAAWGLHAVFTLNRVGAVARANAQRLGDAPPMQRLAVALAALLVALALVASYTHIYTVMLTGGMAKPLAIAFAVSVDAALLMSTAAWFSLRPASAEDMRLAEAQAESHDAAIRAEVEREAAERIHYEREKAARERRELEEIWRTKAAQSLHEAPVEVADGGLVEPAVEVGGATVGASVEPITEVSPSTTKPSVETVTEELLPFMDDAARMLADEVVTRMEPVKVAAVIAAVANGMTDNAIKSARIASASTAAKVRAEMERTDTLALTG